MGGLQKKLGGASQSPRPNYSSKIRQGFLQQQPDIKLSGYTEPAVLAPEKICAPENSLGAIVLMQASYQSGFEWIFSALTSISIFLSRSTLEQLKRHGARHILLGFSGDRFVRLQCLKQIRYPDLTVFQENTFRRLSYFLIALRYRDLKSFKYWWAPIDLSMLSCDGFFAQG